MKDVATLYEEYCNKKGVKFQLDDKVNPYDNTTLFCPAGMQQFKPKFKNPDNTTDAFLDEMFNQFVDAVPKTLATGTSKLSNE